jgi:hypothetical protein
VGLTRLARVGLPALLDQRNRPVCRAASSIRGHWAIVCFLLAPIHAAKQQQYGGVKGFRVLGGYRVYRYRVNLVARKVAVL